MDKWDQLTVVLRDNMLEDLLEAMYEKSDQN